MVSELDYGTCEGCGGKVAEHCIGDATDCIANWPAAGSTPEQRERIHAALCGAPDYNAALALYWWMHLTSEHFYGESWPFQWEDQLRAWIESGLPVGLREPYAGWREEGRRLYSAAGGQWRDTSEGRLFVRGGDMTPAEIEAEAERLFKAWANTLALPADWKLPGEVTRAAWLAVAEASLRAREDMRERAAAEAEQRIVEYSEIDVLDKAPERDRIARRIRRLPLVAATAEHGLNARALSTAEPALPPVTITCLCRPDVTWSGEVRGIRTNHRCTVHGWPQYRDHDGPRLLEAHLRIAALPEEKRRDAMRRLSRSYSAPQTCVEHDGCRREGDEIVWPDGERWPTRTEGT
jgi:hypothetical protein